MMPSIYQCDECKVEFYDYQLTKIKGLRFCHGCRLKQYEEKKNRENYKFQTIIARLEHRHTKRALWLARAMRANDIQSADAFSYYCQEGKLIHIKTYKQWCKIWQWVERKCRAKAEEYR